MRGDRPLFRGFRCEPGLFTPHARGSTRSDELDTKRHKVYPACAGIDRKHRSDSEIHLRLPRMRGDRPFSKNTKRRPREFTPHARGSTHSREYQRSHDLVYPACAGIDPKSPQTLPSWSRLPRMRGDRPHSRRHSSDISTFTPHARGSTPYHTGPFRKHVVYPACAGIDLTTPFVRPKARRLPRMRGDRPTQNSQTT